MSCFPTSNPGHVTECHRKTRQRGVALVTALLVVSLATVAAVAMATRFHVDLRRTGNLLNGEQAYAYARAAESWAMVILRRDLEDNKHDALDEDWATDLPPIPVEGGFVNGRVHDLQGRFNLNNLVAAGEGEVDPAQLDYYKRLLDELDLDPALATTLVDWLDTDINATVPDGAEDDEYLLKEVPYRAANQPLADISELLLIKGYTPEALALLSPHITTLPVAADINVNTATATVLKVLDPRLEDSDIEQLISDRETTPFTTIDEFLNHSAMAGTETQVATGVQTSWFNVQTDVSVGRGQARLESLVFRDSQGLKVYARTRTGKRILPEEE